MDSQLQTTIDHLKSKLTAKLDEANSLKKLINELSKEAGVDAPFPDVGETAQTISNIRSDQFYGQVLVTATRNYLEMRKSARLGAASISEIFVALKNGGYKFTTKDEENAKTTVRISLRKNSSIFHKLPNGEYGLLSWYPSAKESPMKDGDEKPSTKKLKKAGGAPSKEDAGVASDDYITNEQIRAVIFGMTGDFNIGDIEKELKKSYPAKPLRTGALSTALFTLKKKHLLLEVKPRAGSAGAIYRKA